MTEEQTPVRMMNLDEAAAHVGKSAMTIRRLVRPYVKANPDTRYVRKDTRGYRIDPAWLEQYYSPVNDDAPWNKGYEAGKKVGHYLARKETRHDTRAARTMTFAAGALTVVLVYVAARGL